MSCLEEGITSVRDVIIGKLIVTIIFKIISAAGSSGKANCLINHTLIMVLGIQATNYLCMTSWSWIMIPDYLFKEAATSGPLQDYGYVLISRSLPRRWYHHHFTFKHRRRRCQGGGEGKIMEWGALTRRSLTSQETSEGGLVRDIKVIMFGYLDILWWSGPYWQLLLYWPPWWVDPTQL